MDKVSSISKVEVVRFETTYDDGTLDFYTENVRALCKAFCFNFKIIDQYLEGADVRRYYEIYKENWKQSTIAWIVIALLGIFLASDLYFYYHMETRVSVVLLTIFGILTLVYLLTVTYFFPLLAKCDTDLKHLAVMAFVMALKNIGWTIFMLVITAAILAIGVFVMAPVLVIGIGLAAYVNSKIFQMIFKEYHLQTA